MPHLATDTRSLSPAIVFTFPGIGVQHPGIRVQHPRNRCSSSRNSCSRSPGIRVQDRPEYAPDGTLAVVGTDDTPGRVFLWDMVRNVPTGLDVRGVNPRWHPDGQHVALARGGNLLLLDVNDGSEVILVDGGGYSHSFSGDGNTVVYTIRGESGSDDIFALFPGDATPLAIVATDAEEHSPALSPNGRWLAYVSHESGEMHVYIAAFPSGDGKRRVTTNEGNGPLWRQDSGALFFQEAVGENYSEDGRAFRVAAVGSGETLALGQSESLFETYNRSAPRVSTTFVNSGTTYHAAEDGTRFLRVYKSPPEPLTEIVVVQNWVEDLKRLVPTN